MPPFGHAVSKV